MQPTNQLAVDTLRNGEPRKVLDEDCRRLGIPNTPEYIDAIEAFGEERIIILSNAAAQLIAYTKMKGE
jgi:hypothetical protein